jgi:hypothetical protein
VYGIKEWKCVQGSTKVCKAIITITLKQKIDLTLVLGILYKSALEFEMPEGPHRPYYSLQNTLKHSTDKNMWTKQGLFKWAV